VKRPRLEVLTSPFNGDPTMLPPLRLPWYWMPSPAAVPVAVRDMGEGGPPKSPY